MPSATVRGNYPMIGAMNYNFNYLGDRLPFAYKRRIKCRANINIFADYLLPSTNGTALLVAL
jgi:hypothetical protein